LRILERIGALPKLHGDILDPSNGKPCFGLICYPISRSRVIPKCTNPLKSAIRPLGLDHPFVALTEYDVKERFFRALCHGGHFSSPKPRLGLQPFPDDARTLLAVGRPGFRKDIVGDVVALDVERVLDDPSGAVAVISIDCLFEQVVGAPDFRRNRAAKAPALFVSVRCRVTSRRPARLRRRNASITVRQKPRWRKRL
jgi:hypothetical protein